MTVPLKVGLAGLGTVGQGVVKLLLESYDSLAATAGRPLELTLVASRTPRPSVDLGNASFSTDLSILAESEEVDVIVEAIGGDGAAKKLFEQAIENGKHVVTANKALIALHGNDLLRKAEKKGLSVGFEAAVAGGIPIINALTRGLAANRIEWLAGIINGTSNYILTAMSQQGRDFREALEEAQKLGYAEADPTFDVEGIDAAHKLAILAGLAFGTPFDFTGVYTEGISDVDIEDIGYANDLGYEIKHLGIAKRTDQGVESRVYPCLVPHRMLLSKVEDVMNAVLVQGHAVGPTLYVGPGAGAAPTASAVVADLVELAGGKSVRKYNLRQKLETVPLDDLRCAHYLNIPAADQPGVFAHVADTLSRHGVSIESVIQRAQAIRSREGADWVPIVILTNAVTEGDIERAVSAIKDLDGIGSGIRRLRVADLDSGDAQVSSPSGEGAP